MADKGKKRELHNYKKGVTPHISHTIHKFRLFFFLLHFCFEHLVRTVHISQIDIYSGTMTPDEGEDLESCISSDLPDYIVKNLTPLKRKVEKPVDNNKQLERKKGFLESKRSKLQERSNLILQKVREVELRRQLFSRTLKENVQRNLELANERRRAVIEGKRNNARRYLGLLYENPEYQFPSQGDDDTISEVDDDTVSEGEGDGESSVFSDGFSELDMLDICKIQKYFRKRLLRDKVAELKNSNLLYVISNRSADNLKKLLHPVNSSYSKVYDILELMGLPGSYRVFMYAYILMAEFRDTVGGDRHPGYNTNLFPSSASTSSTTERREEQVDDLVSNTLSLILFKSAFVMLKLFTEMIHSDVHGGELSIANPTSMDRLRFAKLWRQYHFYFNIFRPMHLKNTVKTSSQAIDLLESEIEYINDSKDELLGTIMEQREWLCEKRRNLSQLSNYFEQNKAIVFESSSWAQIKGMDFNLFHSLIETVVSKQHNLTQMKLVASQETLDELRNLDFGTGFKKKAGVRYPTTHVVKIQNKTYTFPPFLKVNQWRKYILQNYLNKPKSRGEGLGIPKIIRTGFLSKENKSREVEDELHIENVLQSMGMETIFERASSFIHGISSEEDKEIFSVLDDFLTSAFLNIFEYCIQFHGLIRTSSYEVIASFLAQVRSYKNIFNLERKSQGKLVILFLELHFRTMLLLSEVCPGELHFLGPRCEDFLKILEGLEDDLNLENDILVDIALFYQGTEIIIHNMWLKRCIKSISTEIVPFEVGMVLASSYCGFHVYNTTNGTNSPHLRFPKFYDFLSQFDNSFYSDIARNLDSMFKASVEVPGNSLRSITANQNSNSFGYFYKVFISFILADLHLPIQAKMMKSNGINELTYLFVSELQEIIQETRVMILTGSILALVESVYSQISVNGNILLSYLYNSGDKILGYIRDKQLFEAIQLIEVVKIITDTVSKNIQDIGGKPQGIDFKEEFLMNFLTKQLQSGGSIVLVLLNKLGNILFENEYNDLVRGNFKRIQSPTITFKEVTLRFFSSFYGIYHPVLDWVYDDIGTPEF